MKLLDCFRSKERVIVPKYQEVNSNTDGFDVVELLSTIEVLSENIQDLFDDIILLSREIESETKKIQSNDYKKNAEIIDFTLSNFANIVSLKLLNDSDQNQNSSIKQTLLRAYSGVDFHLSPENKNTALIDVVPYNSTNDTYIGHQNVISMFLVLLIKWLIINGYRSGLFIKAVHDNTGVQFEIVCKDPISTKETNYREIIKLIEADESDVYDKKGFVFKTVLKQTKRLGYKIQADRDENYLHSIKLIVPQNS